jgi:hypothetical protein
MRFDFYAKLLMTAIALLLAAILYRLVTGPNQPSNPAAGSAAAAKTATESPRAAQTAGGKAAATTVPQAPGVTGETKAASAPRGLTSEAFGTQSWRVPHDIPGC